MHRIHDSITLGHRLRTRPVGEMTLHEVRYPGAWNVPPHAHAHANLTFVLGGSIEETACGEARLLRTCEAIIKPAGTVHSDRCGPAGARTIVLELRDPESSPEGGEPEHRAGYAVLRGPEVIRAAARVLRLSRGDTTEVEGEAREVVAEMLALAPPARPLRPARSEPWLELVRDLLHENLARPLRVHELAARVERHPVYVARAFRHRHGCSITAYRRRIQVCEAARAILQSGDSLASIALGSGFADQAHLCRAFRAALGVSPGELRRSVRGR